MVVLATEARKVSVEDAISLDRAVRFREKRRRPIGQQSSILQGHLDERSEKPARLNHVCLALNRMPKMRREDETRGWRFPGKTGSDVCLGRVGGRPHNLVERPQINNEKSESILLPHSSWSLGVTWPRGASRRASLHRVAKPRCCMLLVACC